MSDNQVAEKTQRQEGGAQQREQSPARQQKGQTQTQGQAGRQQQRESRTMTPRVDVLEDESGITLYADMPGVTKDALDIRVEGDSLSIEGEVSAVTPQSMEAVYAEIRVPRYRRTFSLSRELDTGKIEATLKDGVLQLRIPKQEQAQPRKISIKAD